MEKLLRLPVTARALQKPPNPARAEVAEQINALEFWQGLPAARTWLLAVVGTAGLRGIIIAAALGAILTGIRVIMGLDRQYLDKEE